MKQFSQQLHKKATATVKLQAAERRELRERLQSYMEYHPLPAALQTNAKSAKTKAETLPTERFVSVTLPFQALFKYGAVAAALVLVVVPFMAERAVPGDPLYAVKVQFNEELRSTLTFSSVEKVEWETERLNRRIAEARLLASEGRLTETVEAEVADAVREHTENAKREIEVLRTQDADEAAIASITLDTTLAVQATSLKGEEELVDGATTTPETAVSLIATAIDESREEASESTASSTLPAYAKLMARVEQNTTRIVELRNSLYELVPADEMAEVDRRLADIDRAVAAAIAEEGEDELAARRALVEVLQRTQKLIVFMTELEVTETVDIETLVPVVLTAEEEMAAQVEMNETLAEKRAQIEAAALTLEDEAVLEKVQVALASLDALAGQLEAATEFAVFETVFTEAETLADDVLLLLEQTLGSLSALEVIIGEGGATSTDDTIGAEIATSTATSTEAEIVAEETEPAGESDDDTATTSPATPAAAETDGTATATAAVED